MNEHLFCGETEASKKIAFWLRLLDAGHFHADKEPVCFLCGFNYYTDWIIVPENNPHDRIHVTVSRYWEDLSEDAPRHIAVIIERM